MQDRAHPHAGERAMEVVRDSHPFWISPEEALASIEDVLGSIGGTCPECTQALGVSQSTVHRRLTELQNQIGRQLVTRPCNGLSPHEVRPRAPVARGALEAVVKDLEHHCRTRHGSGEAS
jgi:hypothetical protein